MSTPWGQGRVEVQNSRERIAEAMASGRTLSAVYEELKQDFSYPITYKSFWQNTKRVLGSSQERNPSSWGQAQAEILTLRLEIVAGIARKKTLKSIYTNLRADGRFSGTYKSFCENVKRLGIVTGSRFRPGQLSNPSSRYSAPPASADQNPYTPQSSPSPPPPPARSSASASPAASETPSMDGRDENGTPPGKRPRREPIFKRSTLTEEEMYGCRR